METDRCSPERKDYDGAKKPAAGMAATGEERTREFGKALRGEIIRPGDDEYENARRVWNGMIDKHPAMIVRCAGVADVITAVNFARSNGIPVSVRGGGHNVAGNALCDGGMVIDLSRMKAIRVDPATGHARAEGGVSGENSITRLKSTVLRQQAVLYRLLVSRVSRSVAA
jgi:FAD/FMN-containing dehydrogenase